MSYDAPYFLVFLAAVWLAFRVLPWPGWVLLAASIIFYAVAGVRDSLIAAALVLANYAFQFPVARDRRWLAPALALNFGVLAYFKYRVFLTEAAGFDLFTARIVVPLGISFYVFQLSAFLIDISRRRAEPFRSLARFTLFKLFFGQLIAGPIMRWRQFGWQIDRLFERRLPARRLIGLGLGLCALGLTKKIVFADSLAPVVDAIFRDGPADAATAWLGAWLFGFQIYFDFSGYSDIALGLAYLFGIRLAVNFRQPYLARTPQEFWRRWHITLSQWIRDYLYFPLGGRRGGSVQQGVVLVSVMALAGLWHGANWTFVIWGVGWGLTVLLWRVAGAGLARLGAGEWLLTLGAAMVLWVFFRAADLTSALAYVGALFGGRPAGNAVFPDDGSGGLLILAGCLSLLGLHWAETALSSRRALLLLRHWDGPFLRAFFAGIAVWLVLIPRGQQNPFIYFRF